LFGQHAGALNVKAGSAYLWQWFKE